MGEDQEPTGEQDRRDDGLDLARAQMRAAAGSPHAAARRRRRRSTRGTSSEPGTQVSGSGPDDRDPQLLGAMVERLVGEQGWDLELRMRGVFARWPELVGAEVAAHTNPETFTDGKLVVRTDSTAWATQLKLLTPTILVRLNEELGHGTVTLIEVLGPRGPSWIKGRRTTRDGRGPRDTYG
ncbi:DUF721 domain-containing protein [Nocardioides sp.]|uniref:DUF721 domain-containing protein n=1 Tax=Nocardioides sp. TaxID=35761 RepID=UPI0035653B98